MRPRGVNDRTTPKLLRDTGTPERDYLCPYVPPRIAVSLRAESAGRWDWIALLLHYVINPARRLTTNSRLIETCGKTVRACDGRFTGGHGQMCRLHLDAYDHLTAKIAALDALIAETAAPFAAVIARLALVANRVMSPPVSATITSAVRWPIPGIVISWRPGPGWRPVTTSPPANASTPPPARATGTCARP